MLLSAAQRLKHEQLESLQLLLSKLSSGEMDVKGNFIVEFQYGCIHSHTHERGVEDAHAGCVWLWIEYTYASGLESRGRSRSCMWLHVLLQLWTYVPRIRRCAPVV